MVAIYRKSCFFILSKSDALGFIADPFYSPRAPLFDLVPLRLVNYFKHLAQFFCRMIQNSFIDMESMFKLFEEDEEVLFKTRQSLVFVFKCFFYCHVS